MLKLIKCRIFEIETEEIYSADYSGCVPVSNPADLSDDNASMMERYTDRADAFDGLFNMVLGYGIQFLLPCIIGVIAAILFFMERDNDTFKNLRTIPVTSTQMVLAKIYCPLSFWNCFLCGFYHCNNSLRNWNIRSLWNWL